MSYTTEALVLSEDYQLNDINLEIAKEYIRCQLEADVHFKSVIKKPSTVFDYRSRYTDEPLRRSKEVLDELLGNTPQHAALMLVKHDQDILATVLVVVDSRTTLHDGTVGYFIGIRKSVQLMAAQHNDPNVHKIHISSLLIPAVIEWSKRHGADYVVTQPLEVMVKILRFYFGFQHSENKMVSTYIPPISLMIIPYEPIYWNRI